jgi:hypothetical protein
MQHDKYAVAVVMGERMMMMMMISIAYYYRVLAPVLFSALCLSIQGQKISSF